MGCTGSGIPKMAPVRMFHSPEKTRVLERDMEFWTARAIINGRSVPRSPRAPEISANGDLLRVAQLLALKRPMSTRPMVYGVWLKYLVVIIENKSSLGHK